MIYDLIIIGGASAGLSAAIYAARKKMEFIVLTEKTGGQSLLTERIENYPGFTEISGFELVRKLTEHAEKYGTEIKEGEDYKVVEIKNNGGMFSLRLQNGEVLKTRSVIVASGKKPKLLGAPGEKEFTGKGVTYCSICDAPLYSSKDVIVVGGGNAGMESALDLLKYANKIYVLEYDAKIRGDEVSQEKLKQSKKVEFITNAEILEIKGEKFVKSVIYKNRETGEKKEITAEGVFVNVGQIPNSDFVKGFLSLNEFNEITINHKTCETSVPGVFAAGDVTDIPFKQCVIAAGHGALATLSAHKYLQNLN